MSGRDRIDSLLRGGGQGLTLGWGDELIPKLMGKLDRTLGGPADPEGYTRDYAAGSAEADARNHERSENAAAQAAYPVTYGAGQIAGALPSSIAAGGAGGLGGNLAARIAAGGLAGGLRGGIEGSGLGEDGNKVNSGARTAGTGALFGMAGAAAPAAASYIKDLFKGGGPPSGLVPALATAAANPGAQQAERAAATQAGRTGGAIINQAAGIATKPPPRGARAKAPAPESIDREADIHKPITKAVPPPTGERAMDLNISLPKAPKAPNFAKIAGRTADELTPESMPASDIGDRPSVAGRKSPEDLPTLPPDYYHQYPTIPYKAGAPELPPSAATRINKPTTPAAAMPPEAQALYRQSGPTVVPPDMSEDLISLDRPTIPVKAMPREVQSTTRANRPTDLPPSSDAAMDNSMILGAPENKLPVEFSGKYPHDDGPIAPGAENNAQYTMRETEQQAFRNQAQGKPAGWHRQDPNIVRGQSLIDAMHAGPENNARLPTMPGRLARRPFFDSQIPGGSPTGAPAQSYGEFDLKPSNAGSFREFDMTPNDAEPFKRADIQELMSRAPKDE